MKPVKSPKVAASVRQRLLNLATSAGEDFGLVLTRYALERLLYRLSQSKYRDQFILKGAMLFQVWTRTPHRPTRDLDLLGRGDPSIERCQEVFGELCRIPVEDNGLIFFAETVKAEKLREGQDYEGIPRVIRALKSRQVQLRRLPCRSGVSRGVHGAAG